MHYGLIAEEVEKVELETAIYLGSQVETVEYQSVFTMMLSEIQKLNARIAVLEQQQNT